MQKYAADGLSKHHFQMIFAGAYLTYIHMGSS